MFILVSSKGPAADHQSDMIGLYHKTETMTEDGRSIYFQYHTQSQYGDSNTKMLSSEGIWNIENEFGEVILRAKTPSESPTSISVIWEYEDDNGAWKDDPKLEVTEMAEEPSCNCQITLNLDPKIKRDVLEPDVAGVYNARGKFLRGRPVLEHSGGQFTLNVGGGCWRVGSGITGDEHLCSRTAPGMCPADPRASENSSQMQRNWRYMNIQRALTGSRGIRLKCNKHEY